MKIDLGPGSESKIFYLDNTDIDLIVRLLHEELDCHVYQKEFGETCPVWHGRYDHIQDLIIELTK